MIHRNIIRGHVYRLLVASLLATGVWSAVLGCSAEEAESELLTDLEEQRIADLNVRNADGMTPLCLAILKGDLDTIRSLVEAGADTNATSCFGSHEGVAPIHLACDRGNLELVGYLRDVGADLNAKLAGNETPLYIACALGHGKVVERLVKALVASDASLNARDSDGWTPLHKACKQGGLESARHLVKAGADVHATLPDGRTALWMAASSGRIEIIHLLVAADASASQVDNNGISPLHVACGYGWLEVAECLVEVGADVNAAWNGITPLHYASQNGNKKMVKFLVGAGAEINAATSNHLTPFAVAHYYDHKHLMSYFAKKFSSELLTELYARCVMEEGSISCMRIFDKEIERRVVAPKKKGWFRELIKKLSCNKPIVAQRGPAFYPLHEASKRGNLEMVRYLVEESTCKLSDLNTEGRLAFEEALLNEKSETVRWLIENRVPAGLFDADRDDVLRIASDNNRVLTNAVLLTVFGFPYRTVLDKHDTVPAKFRCADGLYSKPVSDKLFDKLKQIYQRSIYYSLSEDLQLLILRKLVEDTYGRQCSNLREDQVSLLALCAICKDEKFCGLMQKLNRSLSRWGVTDLIEAEHFAKTMISSQPLPAAAIDCLTKRLRK